MRECDCPHYGSVPLHLHFVCIEVESGTWKLTGRRQTYQSGYRYDGDRLIGMKWPEGSEQNKRNNGQPDELFVVKRHAPPKSVATVAPLPVPAKPIRPNGTLSMEDLF